MKREEVRAVLEEVYNAGKRGQFQWVHLAERDKENTLRLAMSKLHHYEGSTDDRA